MSVPTSLRSNPVATTAAAIAAAALAFTLPAVPTSHAQSDAPPVTTGSGTISLQPITVIGSPEAIASIAGSAALITGDDIRRQSYTNPNRVLTQVPGVYVREEDGFGLFPNVSLRGADGGRSAKVTIMEDGIMMAPAPYSAPAAYYTPSVGRMSGIEVLKGSSQVRYGPHTTGGVINYLSTPFVPLDPLPAPTAPPSLAPSAKAPKQVLSPDPAPALRSNSAFYLKSLYGSDNYFLNHLHFGHTRETNAGTYGFLAELYHRQNDGFRHIDQAGGRTGFDLIEPMVKVFWEPNSVIPQRLEAKFGYSRLRSNETYLGLTESDFRGNPHRRYVSTRFDTIPTEQYNGSLSYVIEPTPDLRVETTAYATQFTRAWYKLRNVATSDGNVGLSEALAGGGEALDILRGDAAGGWNYRDNRRDYHTLGVQNRVDYDFITGPLEHSLTIGTRLHFDEVRRNQRDDTFLVDDNGHVQSFRRGAQGSGGNRRESTLAFAAFIEDDIALDRFSLKPGLRWEHIRQESETFGVGSAVDTSQGVDKRSRDLFAPGVGVVYRLTDTTSVFASYYRGFSITGPNSAVGGVNDETSNGYEIGIRHYTPALQAELIGFWTDFNDLIVTDLIGASGSAGAPSNAGKVRVYGAEAALRWDPLHDSATDWRLPLRTSATLTSAKLRSDAASADPESIFSGGKVGNRVPYVPDFQISAGVGVEYRNLGVYLDGTYTPAMFGTADNSTSLRAPDGSPDARFGKTESAFLVDLSVKYALTENIAILGGINNLLDDTFITSRVPEGPRGNQPRTYYGGLEITF